MGKQMGLMDTLAQEEQLRREAETEARREREQEWDRALQRTQELQDEHERVVLQEERERRERLERQDRTERQERLEAQDRERALREEHQRAQEERERLARERREAQAQVTEKELGIDDDQARLEELAEWERQAEERERQAEQALERFEAEREIDPQEQAIRREARESGPAQEAKAQLDQQRQQNAEMYLAAPSLEADHYIKKAQEMGVEALPHAFREQGRREANERMHGLKDLLKDTEKARLAALQKEADYGFHGGVRGKIKRLREPGKWKKLHKETVKLEATIRGLEERLKEPYIPERAAREAAIAENAGLEAKRIDARRELEAERGQDREAGREGEQDREQGRDDRDDLDRFLDGENVEMEQPGLGQERGHDLEDEMERSR
jgi:hypothetical protein